MNKIEIFEKYTAKYEDWFERNPWVYQSELKAIKQKLPEIGKGVEIGVGTGRFAKPLGIRIGIEPSKNMGVIARSNGIEVVNAKAEKLPFVDSKFDFVLMVTTVCFLDDIQAAFKEAFRATKAKGRIIIGFVDKDTNLGKAYQECKNNNVFYKFAKFYSVEQIVFYLKKAGYVKFEFSQTIFKDLSEINEEEVAIEGYGDGSFVVISAFKQ
ncbi:MAG: methyltransferase type 11 [Omnitrophica WOR_2 bacterium RIFOXYB2_FULL_38_16]|nr:MAG: methyltransferase type 11 [Omnitrophica WOR_2 bacterium RIFOXYB2_FULL_38_16]